MRCECRHPDVCTVRCGRCHRCGRMILAAKTVSDVVHDRRDAERADDDRREEARDARARGEE